MMLKCECLRIDSIDHSSTLDQFAAIREKCPVLKEIIVPDSIWPEYRKFCESPKDKAQHIPIAYKAFQQGYLANLTGPIHKYCLEGTKPKAGFSSQYKNLAENWVCKTSEKTRFKTAKKGAGHLYELIFANWLENEGWQIVGLEALGAESDVIATSKDGDSCSFEVKLLGEEEKKFDLVVRALTNGTAADSLPQYSPIDYMLYRIYEAAKQLKNVRNRKIVVMILSNFETYFKLPLNEEWINWKSPTFFRKEQDIEELLEGMYEKNPDLDCDVRHYISQIDEIWFFSEEDSLIIQPQKEVVLLAD